MGAESKTARIAGDVENHVAGGEENRGVGLGGCMVEELGQSDCGGAGAWRCQVVDHAGSGTACWFCQAWGKCSGRRGGAR
jgi:hypothetical protein